MAVPVTVNLTADNTNIPYNSSTMLRWSSTIATSCTASGGWSGSRNVSGSESTGTLTSRKIYTLTCRNSNSGEQDSDSVTVNVGSAPGTPTPTPGGGTPTPIPSPTVDLKLSKTKISPDWKNSLSYPDLPTENVSLKAAVTNNDGKITYYWYCNRSDQGTNITNPKSDTTSATNNTVIKNWQLCGYGTAGAYTAKVIIEDKTGRKAQNTAAISVGASETLTVTLTADPEAGTVPLSSVLTADVSGTATGTINYSFWWNCGDATTSVADANLACGTLTTPPAGSCVETAGIGTKCDGINDDPKAIPAHSYTPADTYTAKVIAERGTALPDQAQAPIIVTPNQAPNQPFVDVVQDFCGSGTGKHANVTWTYSDPEGDPQGWYQVRVLNGVTLVHDSGKQSGSAIGYPVTSYLNYNTSYTAAVTVWDDQDNQSLPGTDSFSTLPHNKPWVDFTWSSSPKVGKPVQFTDASTYAGGAPYAYLWDFGCGANCNPATSTNQNPQTTFTRSGNYTVKLTIGDDTGLPYCSKTNAVLVGGSFSPRWREVRPW